MTWVLEFDIPGGSSISRWRLMRGNKWGLVKAGYTTDQWWYFPDKLDAESWLAGQKFTEDQWYTHAEVRECTDQVTGQDVFEAELLKTNLESQR